MLHLRVQKISSFALIFLARGTLLGARLAHGWHLLGATNRSFLAGKRVGDSADPSEFLSVPQQRPKLSVTHDRWPGVKNSMLDNA